MTIPTRKVGEISTQVRGVTYSKQDAAFTALPGYLPVLRAGNIKEHGLTFDDLVYVPASKVSDKQRLRKNDILIAASSGSIDVVGKSARALNDYEGGFGAFCKVLRPNGHVDPGYFAHYFKTPNYRRRISFLAAGANINNLRNEDLDDLEIPLPPLAEQKRIAAILDAADALRAKRREALAQLDTLLQSTFLDMFGDPVTNPKRWEVRTGSEAFDDLTYGTSVKCSDVQMGDMLPVLRIPNIIGGQINRDDLKFADLSGKEVDNLRLMRDDLLFVRTNGNPDYIGRCARFDGSFESIYASYLIRARLKAKAGLDAEFLKHQIESTAYRREVRKEARTTAGNYNLSTAGIKKFRFIVPPLELQARYKATVEAAESQKSRLVGHLTELDTLFVSLQSRAFRGDL